LVDEMYLISRTLLMEPGAHIKFWLEDVVARGRLGDLRSIGRRIIFRWNCEK